MYYNQQANEIVQDLESLKSIHENLHEVIHNQQNSFDTIEDHIEKTALNVQESMRALEQAKDIQTAKRVNKILLTSAIDTGLIAVGSLAGIPGIVTGIILGGVVTTIIYRSG